MLDYKVKYRTFVFIVALLTLLVGLIDYVNTQ